MRGHLHLVSSWSKSISFSRRSLKNVLNEYPSLEIFVFTEIERIKFRRIALKQPTMKKLFHPYSDLPAEYMLILTASYDVITPCLLMSFSVSMSSPTLFLASSSCLETEHSHQEVDISTKSTWKYLTSIIYIVDVKYDVDI